MMESTESEKVNVLWYLQVRPVLVKVDRGGYRRFGSTLHQCLTCFSQRGERMADAFEERVNHFVNHRDEDDDSQRVGGTQSRRRHVYTVTEADIHPLRLGEKCVCHLQRQ